MKIETVQIMSENGTVTINKCDYDPEIHDLVEPVPEPGLFVVKSGKRFKVAGSDGKPVEDEAFQKSGYADEAAAWAAIMSMKS